jgi:hypothetical protein
MLIPQAPALADARWRKSSHSYAGNNCVEVAQAGTTYAVRDSKDPAAGHLAFSGNDWGKFIAAVKCGAYDQ